MNAGVGAQLAGNLYGSANRPPLTHAQTAPPQAHGIPGVAPQHQPVQIGQQQQQQPVKIQPLQSQQHQQPGKPQPGYTHPNPYQRPPHSQPTYQPVGIQTPGRPPVVYNQNPALAQQLAAVNIHAQAQAQAGIAQAQANLYQQQQYPIVRPFMVNNMPPPAMINPMAPNAQPQEQPIIDANTAATAAVMIGSAVGAALRPNNSQPQHAYGNTQGYAPQDHAPHAGSNGAENHGYPAGNHAGGYEQPHDSSIPPQAPTTYTDNNYTATDTTYVDNSTYSANNVYIDNTDVVNNTIIIDNSTASAVDTTYSDTSYVDATSFNNTEITTNVNIDVDINSTVYADSGVAAFSVDESLNIASTTDVTVASADYSGNSWGDFSF
ncbi:hypothetical protein GGR58DRAFT_84533 [Xylaria digitata]|nr:hypothetical protein GGR58DRAFT_84533 [Xylaria digitata]